MAVSKRLLAVVLASSALLAACSQAGGTNSGQSTQTVVGSYGGDYDNFHKQFVVPVFDASFKGSAPSVVFDSQDTTGRVTKVIAQKGSKSGEFDVVMQTDADIVRLVQAHALAKLDLSRIPNASHILPTLRNPYCVPQIYSAEVIIYNKDKVPAPSSWKDLWNPKYKGKVGAFTSAFQEWFWVAAAAAKGGDPGTDIPAGYSYIKSLGDQIKPFSSNDELGQAMISGETWITENRKARVYQWNQSGGDKFAAVVPKEGTIPTAFYACIPKNAPDMDAAYHYLNALLDPKAQQGFATHMGYAPTVDNASLPPKLEQEVGFTKAEEARIYPLNSDYMAAHYAEQQNMWNKDVLAH